MPPTHIDERRLETDTSYRFGYLAEFMGFGPDDVATIHAAGPLLAPLVPALVDTMYDRLFAFDATKRHFVPRQSGYDGPVPESLESLSLDHPMIAFRKQHLGRYLTRLVTAPYDGNMAEYLGMVGKIHTPAAGSPQFDVPLVQMNALLGFVATALTSTIMWLAPDREVASRTILAFSKLLWIQNDLIGRHYQAA